MTSKKIESLLILLKLPIDFLAVFLAGISSFLLRFTGFFQDLKPVLFSFDFQEILQLNFANAFLWLLVFVFFGFYKVDQNKKFSTEIKEIFLGAITSLGIAAIFIVFKQKPFDSRFLLFVGWLLAIFFVIIGRFLIRGLKYVLYKNKIGLKRVFLLGSKDLTKKFKQKLNYKPYLGYKVVKTSSVFNQKIKKQILINKIEEVILLSTNLDNKILLEILDFCTDNHLVFKFSSELFSVYSSNMFVYPLLGWPIVELKKSNFSFWGLVIKRLIDLFLSLLFIIFLSPLMLIISVLIYLETGRPIIYKNRRVGKNGIGFFTLKFRSMYQDKCTGEQFGLRGQKAEEYEKKLIKKYNTRQGPIYKIGNDPRVTKIGKFIRKWSLDELPQLFNVLLGQMSLVGPRPHQFREVNKYQVKFKRVLSVKPGITGLSQISGRSDLSFDEEINLDLFYLKNWSIFLDLIILFKTPFILFKKRQVE